MIFDISLDKRTPTHISKKFMCPQCDKKRFVRYFDFDKSEYLPNEFGRCDRESSCGYNCPPSRAYFKSRYSEEKTVSIATSGPKIIAPVYNIAQGKTRAKPESLSFGLVEESLRRGRKNNFLIGIKRYFGELAAYRVKQKFKLGAHHRWQGANVFWQIDISGELRTGKIMLYDLDLKRVKEPFPHVNWVHSALIKEGKISQYFSLKQCFFGEHQLQENTKTVVVVESAKTAVIGWLWKPEYLWLSSEGSNGLNIHKCSVLNGRKVLLAPDFDDKCREVWDETARRIQDEQGCDISISTLGSKVNNGSDLADHLLNNPIIISEIINRVYREPLAYLTKEEVAAEIADLVLQQNKVYSTEELLLWISNYLNTDIEANECLTVAIKLIESRMILHRKVGEWESYQLKQA